jgi:hypothetical protein
LEDAAAAAALLNSAERIALECGDAALRHACAAEDTTTASGMHEQQG